MAFNLLLIEYLLMYDDSLSIDDAMILLKISNELMKRIKNNSIKLCLKKAYILNYYINARIIYMFMISDIYLKSYIDINIRDDLIRILRCMDEECLMIYSTKYTSFINSQIYADNHPKDSIYIYEYLIPNIPFTIKK
jgi:sulfur transfer complex TusBCD TusB component (DsrH family)